MPVVNHAGHEVAPDAVQFVKRNGKSPRRVVLGHHRHLVFIVLTGRQIGHDRAVVIDPCDALAVAKRLLGLGVADEGDDLGAVFLRYLLVIEGALLAANRLALEVHPIADDALLGQHVGAGSVVVRIGNADHLTPVGLVGHGGDHQIDLALLQELHAVGRLHRHQFERDAQGVGHVLGHVDFHADQLAA